MPELDDHGHTPVKEGYVRIYDDQFERNYTDYTKEEVESWANDPLASILWQEIQKEVNKDIIEKMRKFKNYGDIA
jgi:hypothetical protein